MVDAAVQCFIRPFRSPSITFLALYVVPDFRISSWPPFMRYEPVSHLVEPIFVVVPADVEGLEDGVLKLYTPDTEALADGRLMTKQS